MTLADDEGIKNLIRVEEVMEALADKGGADIRPCTACGVMDWKVLESTNLVLDGKTRKIIPVACKLCGLLRFHVADMLLG
jgi:hypothetical protein